MQPAFLVLLYTLPMPTGYSDNKDSRGLEDERSKRAKEQRDRTEKQHLAADLASKKNFLFSTKTTIDVKSAVIKEKEVRLRVLTGEITSIDLKKKELEAKEKAAEENKRGKISKEVAATEAEIAKVKRVLETEKQHLTALEKEDQDLKNKKEAPAGNEGAHIKADISLLERQKQQKDHDFEVTTREHDELKRQVDQLSRDKEKLEAEVRALELRSR